MELRPPDSNSFSFNGYDILSNFLPGAILLMGLWFPFSSIANPLPTFSLEQGLVLVILAFAAGVATQGLGSVLSSKRYIFSDKLPFNEHMNRIESTNKEDLTNVEYGFVQFCENKIDFTDRFEELSNDDYERLFKMLVTYLETKPTNRALRIQALYLSSRGLSICFMFLTLYYLGCLLPVGVLEGRFANQLTAAGISSPVYLLSYTIAAMFLTYLFIRRTNHFEEDVAVYIMSEVYLLYCDLKTQHTTRKRAS